MERITYKDIPEGMFNGLRATENFIHNSSLDFKLLELIRLRVGQINGCAYCVDMHYKELKHHGETELRLSSICVWEDTPYFTTQERAVLTLTEAVTNLSQNPISDEVYDLLPLYFSKTEICYLTLAISQINAWTRLMKTFKFIPGKYQINTSA